MREVRDKLTELLKPLRKAEKLYVRLSATKSRPAGEARERLYLAQDALQVDMDLLHDSLEGATNIVNRALDDLPKTRRSSSRNSTEFVRLMLKALQGGHGEHFANQGKPMPGFDIRVARKAKPFPQIAEIVSEATGGWSVDDAIRAYLKKSNNP
jgi:hypothetical protein